MFFLCYVLAIIMLTLSPTPDDAPGIVIKLVPFSDIGRLQYGRGVLNVVGNILMFLPLGMFWVRRPFVQMLLLAALLSASIELCQLGLSLLARADRWTSVDDVILNASGAALGYAVSIAWHWWDRP